MKILHDIFVLIFLNSLLDHAMLLYTEICLIITFEKEKIALVSTMIIWVKVPDSFHCAIISSGLGD